jgi:serine/threonine protein kinase
VTEWADGETSDRALRELPPGGTRDALVRALAAALARLHALGLRHRDLKPQNVFFDLGRGSISLVDFDGVRYPLRLSAAARRRDLERWLRDPPSADLTAIVRLSYQHDYKLAEIGIPQALSTRTCLPGGFAYNTLP